MAKIALELEQALARRRADGTPGRTTARIMAGGAGWTVADVVCTSGPSDRPFEERHSCHIIALVLAGVFQYRSSLGRDLMTPGSLMLGSQDHCFECGHEHGEGDRCVSFWYAPDYFERLAADAGAPVKRAGFSIPRLPPVRELSALIARSASGALGAAEVPWEELTVTLAVRAVRLAAGVSKNHRGLPLNAEARVSRAVAAIDRHPDAGLSLATLSREAGLSPYYFLRTFLRVTGTTPHQYVRRARLREAATRLVTEPGTVLDIALDSGFGDISNFNRAFRTEFGLTPQEFRRASR